MFFRYLNTFKSTTINYDNYNDLRMSRMEMKFFKIEKTRSISFFHRFFFFFTNWKKRKIERWNENLSWIDGLVVPSTMFFSRLSIKQCRWKPDRLNSISKRWSRRYGFTSYFFNVSIESASMISLAIESLQNIVPSCVRKHRVWKHSRRGWIEAIIYWL